MSCEALTGGVSKGCGNNMGGLLEFYLTDKSNVTSIDETSGHITAFNMAGSPPAKFYKFEFNKNTGFFNEDEPINVENGSAYYLQTATLVIPKRDLEKRNTIKLLAQRDLVGIAKDGNGIYWYMGEENGLLLTENTSGSGTVKADGSKYTLVFTAEELDPAKTVEESAILAVL
jgi:hypothetical protein